MVNITYKKVKYTFPTAYKELTLRQFFALRDNSKNIFKMLEILCVTPKVTEKQWKHKIDIDLFDSITPFIDFIQKDPPAFDSYLMPDTIEISGQRYRVPAGIGMKTLAQKICFETAIRSTKTGVDLIPTALAIYFQPDIDDQEFDEDRLNVCIEKILDCKVNEAFPIAGFFFERYKQYLNEREKSLPTSQHQKKSQPELIVSKSSVSMARFGVWRGLLIRTLRAFYGWIITRSFWNYSIKKKSQPFKDPIKKS